jgi:hypothetical protein
VTNIDRLIDGTPVVPVYRYCVPIAFPVRGDERDLTSEVSLSHSPKELDGVVHEVVKTRGFQLSDSVPRHSCHSVAKFAAPVGPMRRLDCVNPVCRPECCAKTTECGVECCPMPKSGPRCLQTSRPQPPRCWSADAL